MKGLLYENWLSLHREWAGVGVLLFIGFITQSLASLISMLLIFIAIRSMAMAYLKEKNGWYRCLDSTGLPVGVLAAERFFLLVIWEIFSAFIMAVIIVVAPGQAAQLFVSVPVYLAAAGAVSVGIPLMMRFGYRVAAISTIALATLSGMALTIVAMGMQKQLMGMGVALIPLLLLIALLCNVASWSLCCARYRAWMQRTNERGE